MNRDIRLTAEGSHSGGNGDSIKQVVEDVAAFLDNAINRFNGLLDRCVDIAARERELIERESWVTEYSAEVTQQRERWQMQRQQEIAQLQQQIEELTQAWLRLENEQRGGSTHGESQAPFRSDETATSRTAGRVEGNPVDASSAASSSAEEAVEDPAATGRCGEPVPAPAAAADVAGLGSPNTKSPLAGIAKAPGTGGPALPAGHGDAPTISRHRQPVQAPIHEGGRPETVTKGHSSPGGDRDSGQDPLPPREFALEQFSQLQREFGFGNRPQ